MILSLLAAIQFLPPKVRMGLPPKTRPQLPPQLIARTAVIVNLNSIPKLENRSESRLELLSDHLGDIFIQGGSVLIATGGPPNSSPSQIKTDLNSIADLCHRENEDFIPSSQLMKMAMKPNETSLSKQKMNEDGVLQVVGTSKEHQIEWMEGKQKCHSIPINDLWSTQLASQLQGHTKVILDIEKEIQANKKDEIVTASPFIGPSIFKTSGLNEAIIEQLMATLFFQKGVPALFYGDDFGLPSDSRSQKFTDFPPEISQYDQKLETLVTNLVLLREKRQSLSQGDLSILRVDPDNGILVAVRKYRFESTLLFINIDILPHEVRMDYPSLGENSIQDLLGGAVFNSTSLSIDIDLPAQGFAILGTPNDAGSN